MSEENALFEEFRQAESVEPITSPEPSTIVETPPVDVTASTPRAPIDLDDDVPVKFKFNGEVVEKTWKEALQQHVLLPGDYTRKTQALAAERNTFTAERTQFDQLRQQFEQERQQLAVALRDPKRIEALYLAAVAASQGQTEQPQAQPAAVDPAALQQHILSQTSQLFDQRLASFQQQMQLERQNAERAQTLDSHVTGILDSNPALKALPNITNYLYGEVANMVEQGKTTVEEAKQMLSMTAQSIADSLNTHFNAAKKVDAVAEAKLKNGIEPRGGSPVLPQAKTYNRKLGLDDADMEADIIAYMKAQTA